jgi:hypothetical protein
MTILSKTLQRQFIEIQLSKFGQHIEKNVVTIYNIFIIKYYCNHILLFMLDIIQSNSTMIYTNAFVVDLNLHAKH